MRIKNLESLMSSIRSKLGDYLQTHGRDIAQTHFKCPNASLHKNGDENPSCGFYPDEEHFHCFTCKAAGDIFKAASLIEGRPAFGEDFITDNVIYLASLFNIKYEEKDLTDEEKRKAEIFKVLELATTLMHNTLKKNNKLTDGLKNYVSKRGWKKIFTDFDFGWCCYGKLISKLKSKDFTDDVLIQSGLIPSEEQKRKSYQKLLFEDRFVFPIRNHYGRVVAFASRDYKGSRTTARYMNFKNTDVYKKGRILFNLDNARLESSSIYIVEGYTDVFTMYLSGIKNVVALCGKNFTDEHYKLLVKCGIKKIIFCLDNEDDAYLSLDSVIHNTIGTKTDLEVYIKKLIDENDPDEFVRKKGIEAFKELKELTIFEYQLEKVKASPNEYVYRSECLSAILRDPSPIEKERLVKRMSKETGISESAILGELQRFDGEGSDRFNIMMADVLAEQEKMNLTINEFERWAWNRGKLLGLDFGWPILTGRMEGLQSGVYLVGGRSNIGKSAWCLQVAQNLLLANQGKICILYFSIDDNKKKVVPRILSNLSGIAINDVSNPTYKILNNKNLTKKQIEIIEQRRDAAVSTLRSLSTSWAIKDVSEGRSLKYVEKMINVYRAISPKKQLVVFIDNLHKIAGESKKQFTRDKFTDISEGVKRLVNIYDIPIIATVEVRKSTDLLAWPTEEDIKETIDLAYDADAIWMLHNELTVVQDSTKTKLFFIDEFEEVQPIIGLWARKNKTSEFKGRIYYKFHPRLAKIVEVNEKEREYYESSLRQKRRK